MSPSKAPALVACQRRVEGIIRECGGAPATLDFRLTFNSPQRGNEIGRFDKLSTLFERVTDAIPVETRQSNRVRLDSESAASKSEVLDKVCERTRRLDALDILPYMDVAVGQRGCLLRLSQVGCASQQCQPTVGIQNQALKQGKAERIVSANPEVAFWREHQKSGEPPFTQQRCCTRPTRGKFRLSEMQWHDADPLNSDIAAGCAVNKRPSVSQLILIDGNL